MALLRAEGRLKNPWVLERIARAFPGRDCRVLDVGCGAGFLANALSRAGHRAEGLDLSPGQPQGGARPRRHGPERLARRGRLPPALERTGPSTVVALDFLEHVETTRRRDRGAGGAAARRDLLFPHLQPLPLAWMVVIKGLEWFVRDTPERMHVLPLFVLQSENGGALADAAGMRAEGVDGDAPGGLSAAAPSGGCWPPGACRRISPSPPTRSLAI